MDAGGTTDKTQRFLIEQACKAPSGHNTQPWLFEPGAQQIRIHPDLRQALPVVDPKHCYILQIFLKSFLHSYQFLLVILLMQILRNFPLTQQDLRVSLILLSLKEIYIV